MNANDMTLVVAAFLESEAGEAPATTNDIARRAGYSRSRSFELLKRAEAAGYVVRSHDRSRTGRGRPVTRWELHPSRFDEIAAVEAVRAILNAAIDEITTDTREREIGRALLGVSRS